MAHPYHHALSSVKKWGGTVDDYIRLHTWFDESKEILADFRHRALRHHAEGIFMLEKIFGMTITLSTGRVIPTRWVGEQHVLEDLGRIPSFADWARAIAPEPWMGRSQKLHKTLEAEPAGQAPELPSLQPCELARLQQLPPPCPAPQTPPADTAAGNVQAYIDRLAQSRSHNRNSLCAAMLRLGITSAVVAFSSEPGTQPVTSFEIVKDNQKIPVPAATVNLQSVASPDHDCVDTSLPLKQALSAFTFDALSEFHLDWQLGDGAFGTVAFRPHQGEARLELKYRSNIAVWTATDL